MPRVVRLVQRRERTAGAAVPRQPRHEKRAITFAAAMDRPRCPTRSELGGLPFDRIEEQRERACDPNVLGLIDHCHAFPIDGAEAALASPTRSMTPTRRAATFPPQQERKPHAGRPAVDDQIAHSC